jgi:prepilin-type N-terminal cleavage/methylation domain-containing protein
MTTPNSKKGFTLIEILIAMTLLSLLVAVSISALNYNNNVVAGIANDLMSKLSDIESGFNMYVNEKNIPPTGLSDTTFAPTYIFAPVAPQGFDATYGTNGFNLAQRTGQTSPNNGWYVCAKVAVSDATDLKYLAIKQVASKVSPQKYFYNTSCPATTNMTDPVAAATVYSSYWISRN